MKEKWLIVISFFVMTSLMTVLPCLGKNYDVWNDETYDFRSIRQIYVSEINTDPIALESSIKEYRLKAYFFEKVKTLKDWTIITPPLSPPAAALPREAPLPQPSSAAVSGATSSNPGDAVAATAELAPSAEEIASDDSVDSAPPNPLSNQPQPPEPIKIIPDDVISSDADILVTAQILAYQVGTGVIPAHTEWKSYRFRDVYYDRHGHPRWATRHVMYPLYVPSTYIPVSSVGVQFCVYDTRTGRLISISEDIRTRNASDDVYGIYKRIVNKFFKNLKKQLVKTT